MRNKIIYTFIVIVLFSHISATRYLHETDSVSLRVDDAVPVSFVEFRYKNKDLLWNSFLALLIDDRLSYGRATTEGGELTISTFVTLSPLQLFEIWNVDTDTTGNIDSNLTGAISTMVFSDTVCDIEISQKVQSFKDGRKYIDVEWIIKNSGTAGWSSANALFFYDADVPEEVWDNDMSFRVPSHFGAGVMASSVGDTSTGFLWLSGGQNHSLLRRENWYLSAQNEDSLRNLFSSLWETEDSIGDVGVGIKFDLPNLMPYQSETLRFVLWGAGSQYSAESLANNIDTLWVVEEPSLEKPQFEVLTFPNPFNSSCVISAPAGAEIEIYDISGRKVWEKRETQCENKIIWTPEPSVKSGIYLVRARIGDVMTTRRVILMR